MPGKRAFASDLKVQRHDSGKRRAARSGRSTTGCITASTTRRPALKPWLPALAGTNCRPSKTAQGYDAWNIDPGTYDVATHSAHPGGFGRSWSKRARCAASFGYRAPGKASKSVQEIGIWTPTVTRSPFTNDIDWHETHVLHQECVYAFGHVALRHLRDSLRNHRAAHHPQQQLGGREVSRCPRSAGLTSAMRSTA